jgi:rRNA maturation endonuclease Nob1
MVSKKDRMGQVRCLSCFTRFRPPLNAEKVTCPECGLEWRISWTYPNVAKIRGPVWKKLKEETQKPESKD